MRKTTGRVVSSILLVTVSVWMTACSQGGTGGLSAENGNSGGTKAEVLETAEQSPDEEKRLRFSIVQYEGEHGYVAANKVKETVEKATGGKIKIDVYPASQLGEWTQIYDELMMGTLDLAITSVPDTYNIQVSAGFLPYLATDWDQLRTVYAPESFLSQTMVKLQEEQGIKFFGIYCEGFTGIGTSKEIKNPGEPDKDKDVLVRVPSNDVWRLTFERLGFRTSTIPYNDTYAALQTGVIDGWAGCAPHYHYTGYRDVESAYYAYDAVADGLQVLMSEKTWNSLSEDEQIILQEALEECASSSIDSAEASDREYKDKLRESGMEIIEFTPEEKERMAEDVRNYVWGELEDEFTPEFIKNLRESLQ